MTDQARYATELERLRAGDRQTVEAIYDQCFGMIANWVRKNSGTQKDAEDVFQDALVSLYQRAGEPDFSLSCKLSTFIFSIAKNIWLYRLRSKGRHVFTDVDATDSIPHSDMQLADELIEKAEAEFVYQRNFDKLSERCRQVLTLFFNGLSMQEITQKMGLVSDNATRKKKHHCKNELISLVEKDPLFKELKKA